MQVCNANLVNIKTDGIFGCFYITPPFYLRYFDNKGLEGFCEMNYYYN